jgi:hypothetical protein
MPFHDLTAKVTHWYITGNLCMSLLGIVYTTFNGAPLLAPHMMRRNFLPEVCTFSAFVPNGCAQKVLRPLVCYAYDNTGSTSP